MRFGFVEIPNLTAALKRVKGLDPLIDLDNAIYFATRDLVVARPGTALVVGAAAEQAS
jgi:KUP system potassium uptake protein